MRTLPIQDIYYYKLHIPTQMQYYYILCLHLLLIFTFALIFVYL